MKKKRLPKGKTVVGTVSEWMSEGALSYTSHEPPWGVLEFIEEGFTLAKGQYAEEQEGFYHVEKGDFLRIFNDAARKGILWEGTYDPTEAFNQYQKNENKTFWRNLISKKRPALLVRAGAEPKKKPKQKKEKIIMKKMKMNGTIFNFSGQGSEGNIKSFQDEAHVRREPYEGIHCLENGDLLTIFNDKSRTDVLWHGKVKLTGEMANYSRGTQEGFSEESWENLFRQEKPATLVKRLETKRK